MLLAGVFNSANNRVTDMFLVLAPFEYFFYFNGIQHGPPGCSDKHGKGESTNCEALKCRVHKSAIMISKFIFHMQSVSCRLGMVFVLRQGGDPHSKSKLTLSL